MNDNESTKSGPAGSESPLGAVRGLVEEHPVAMLAGGILLGALIAGTMSRPAAGAPRRSFGRRAVQIATIGAELAAAYVAGADHLLDTAAAPEPASPPTTPEPAKPQARRINPLATRALRAFVPVLGRHLRRKPTD